jgi:hypothetical protein
LGRGKAGGVMREWLSRRLLRVSIALARLSCRLVGERHRVLFYEEVDRARFR